MMTALVTNEKWPFQFPWCRTLGVHPPLREGCWGHTVLVLVGSNCLPTKAFRNIN